MVHTIADYSSTFRLLWRTSINSDKVSCSNEPTINSKRGIESGRTIPKRKKRPIRNQKTSFREQND
jgi:hypothetical protein